MRLLLSRYICSVLIFFLSACSTAAATLPEETATTISATLFQTNTAEVLNSQTPSPTTITITSTQAHTLLPLPTVTPMNTRTPSPKGYDLFVGLWRNIRQSPDGQWLWSDSGLIEEGEWLIHKLQIVSTDGKYEWWVQPRPEDIHTSHRYGDVWYEPLFWLSGEQPYVFLIGRDCCRDGVGVGHNMRELVRLNLLNGQLSIQVPFTDNDYLFSFSPTGKYLLMEQVGSFPLQITRLIDGHVNSIDLPKPYEQAIQAYWSPNGNLLALEICASSTVYRSCGQRPVIIVKPEEAIIRTVVPDLSMALNLTEQEAVSCKIEWKSNEQLIIICGSKQLEYDVITGINS
jgi:hypothetical protein